MHKFTHERSRLCKSTFFCSEIPGESAAWRHGHLQIAEGYVLSKEGARGHVLPQNATVFVCLHTSHKRNDRGACISDWQLVLISTFVPDYRLILWSVGCDTVWSGRWVPQFRWNALTRSVEFNTAACSFVLQIQQFDRTAFSHLPNTSTGGRLGSPYEASLGLEPMWTEFGGNAKGQQNSAHVPGAAFLAIGIIFRKNPLTI